VVIVNTVKQEVVARFNPDGTPDQGFGSGGATPLTINGTVPDEGAPGVALQPDGKIVVAIGIPPTTAASYQLVRLNPDGSPDTSFGPNGLHVYPFLQSGGIVAVGVEMDGSIVAAADFGTNPSSVLVFRVTGTNGNQTGADQIFNFPGNSTVAGLAFQPDGHVVVAGTSGTTSRDFAVARLPADLSTVQTVHQTFGADDLADGLAVDPTTGAITVVGVTDVNDQVNKTYTFAAMRFKSDLSGLDPTFNPSGAGTSTPGTAVYNINAGPNGVVLQPDGKAVVTGTSLVNNVANAVAFRVNVDGSIDPTFAAATGNVLTVAQVQQGGGAAVDSEGRIDVAGVGNGLKGVVFRVEGRTGLPTRLAVGGAVSANANVYTPSGGAYSNPPAITTPANVFPGYSGEVRVATADVNGDGVPDVVEVTGPGAPTRMAVVDGKTHQPIVPATDPFGDANFAAGAYVTAGDISGTGRADWAVTPALTGGPRVVIFQLLADGTFDITSASQPSLVANFFGIGDPGFRDGDRVALGDVNGDGVLDVFSIAAFNGGPRTALYDGKDVLVARAAGRDPNKLVNDFYASADGTDAGRGGRSIAVGDFSGDGVADLAVTGDNLLGTGNQVTIFNGADLVAGKVPGFGAGKLISFTVSGQPGSALVSLAAVDADGDNLADLVVGSGAGQPSKVRTYLGSTKTATPSGEPTFTDLDPYGAVLADGVFVG
jgi:uncharacterized delta-60 repeat protein